MIFEPWYIRWLKGTAIVTVILGGYLWVSVDEWEFEQQQTVVTAHQLHSIPTIPTIPEPEPELPVYAEPEQQIPGWIVPPEPVRKHVAKVKRKIKKTVKNGG
jgi:hypothetical protein